MMIQFLFPALVLGIEDIHKPSYQKRRENRAEILLAFLSCKSDELKEEKVYRGQC